MYLRVFLLDCQAFLIRKTNESLDLVFLKQTGSCSTKEKLERSCVPTPCWWFLADVDLSCGDGHVLLPSTAELHTFGLLEASKPGSQISYLPENHESPAPFKGLNSWGGSLLLYST